jgi:hypothetical protein
MKRISISVLLVSFFSINAISQVNVRDSLLAFSAFNVSFGWQIPTGDLAKRFGAFGSVGGSYLRKQKSGLLWGVKGNFLFGDDVKQKNMLRLLCLVISITSIILLYKKNVLLCFLYLTLHSSLFM